MSNIIIYDSERNAGLEEQIRSQASIAYASPTYAADTLQPSVLTSCDARLNKFLATAGKQDSDIYHTFSILVTSAWNKNDDVFAKDEVWGAKDTPQYKPANLEHDEKQIVGGIIGSWPIDSEFQLIEGNTTVDQLPDIFHILTSSVIYRQWQDPEYQARAEDLIAKIEENNMFVSMECIFRGFDYAVITPDNKNHIVARSAETAFLSQHLKAYGGNGNYQDHKVGRLLRNVTFSGKGFVERPANPDSIIFDREHIFDFADASVAKNLLSDSNGVSVRVEEDILSKDIIEQEISMSNDFLSDQVKELKEALAAVQAENKELTTKLSTANVEKLEAATTELSKTVEALGDELTKANADLVEAKSQIESLEAKISEETTTREAAELVINEMKEEQVKAQRTAILIDAGVSEDDVAAKLETFASLSDEQFEEVVSTIATFNVSTEEVAVIEEEAETIQSDVTTEAEETDADCDPEADEEVLETASIDEDIDLSVASDDEPDETTHIRAGLHNWVNSYVFSNEDSNE